MHESKLGSHAADDTSEATYWYILAGSKQQGPIFLSRLRQMAHQGKLAHDDRVRRGTTGEWVRAGDLRNVLFPDAAELESMAAKEAAVEQKPEPQVREPGILANLVSSIRDRIETFYQGIIQGCVDRLGAMRAIASWLALVAVFVSLIVVLVNHFHFDWSMIKDPIETYSSIWDELKEKRKAKATPAEWDAFAVKARREITPLIARLERTASTNNRFSQQLLWVGRDYLLKMVDDSHDTVSPAEKKFAEELQCARWLKEGKNLSGQGPFGRGSRSSSGIMSDATTTVLGVLFLILDVAIIVWFFRGGRKGKNTV